MGRREKELLVISMVKCRARVEQSSVSAWTIANKSRENGVFRLTAARSSVTFARRKLLTA